MTANLAIAPSDNDGDAQQHDIEAERLVLDALMTNPGLAADTGLAASHYFKPAHAVIHTTVLALAAAGEPTDPITVKARLEADGNTSRAGGPNYLADIYTSALAGIGNAAHARRVIELAQKRELGILGARLAQLARNPSSLAADDLEHANKFLAGLTDTLTVRGPLAWNDVLTETLDDLEQRAEAAGQDGASRHTAPTGMIDLDRILGGGLHADQLVIVAGRPGMGKSVTAVDIVRAATLRHAVPALLCSLEMNRVSLAKRILAAQYSLQLDKLTAATLTEDDWVLLARAAGEHTDAPLWIDDSPGQTLATIQANARRMHRSDAGLGLLVVDYLQLVEAGRGQRTENRQQEVSALSRGFKLLAKELQIPVVVCAQLNRGSEHRSDKTPQLSDLRESGAIEQDADVVILLHRPDYYDPNDSAGEVQLIVAKNRNGATGSITAAAQLHYSRFVDMAAGA